MPVYNCMEWQAAVQAETLAEAHTVSCVCCPVSFLLLYYIAACSTSIWLCDIDRLLIGCWSVAEVVVVSVVLVTVERLLAVRQVDDSLLKCRMCLCQSSSFNCHCARPCVSASRC